MKTATKASAAKPKKSTSMQIRFPTNDVWTKLVKDLRLSETQADELQIAIRHANEDLRIFREVMATRPNRNKLVASLKRMEKPLRRLKLECNRGMESVQLLLPLEFLASIGRSWSFAGISEALGEDLYPRRYDLTKTDLDLRAIEEETAPLRQTFGLRHGHVLLTSLIIQWHAEIEKQLVLERLNKGGRKAQ